MEESIMAYLKHYRSIQLKRMRKTAENLSQDRRDLSEIRTGFLLNKSPELYSYTK